MVLIKIITLARGTYSWTLFLSLGQRTTRFRAARVRIWEDLAKMHGTTTWRHAKGVDLRLASQSLKPNPIACMISSLVFFPSISPRSCWKLLSWQKAELLSSIYRALQSSPSLVSQHKKWQSYQRLVHSFRLHSLHVDLSYTFFSDPQYAYVHISSSSTCVLTRN